MSNEEILKLAVEAGFGVSGGFIMPPRAGHITSELESFYKIAYNKGLEAAAKVCGWKWNGYDDPHEANAAYRTCNESAVAIKKLELK